MQIYELGYLILPSIAEEKLGAVLDKIKAIFAKAGGKELDGEMPFLQPLAYTMSKTVGASRYVVNEAYIGWMKYEIEAEKALEVKMALEKIDELLRFLLIKAPMKTTFTFAKAKALLAEKEARDSEETQASSEQVNNPIETPVIE